MTDAFIPTDSGSWHCNFTVYSPEDWSWRQYLVTIPSGQSLELWSGKTVTVGKQQPEDFGLYGRSLHARISGFTTGGGQWVECSHLLALTSQERSSPREWIRAVPCGAISSRLSMIGSVHAWADRSLIRDGRELLYMEMPAVANDDGVSAQGGQAFFVDDQTVYMNRAGKIIEKSEFLEHSESTAMVWLELGEGWVRASRLRLGE